MGEFVRVGKVAEFREGRGRVVKVEGVAVAVFRVGGRVFAIKDACPHMGYSLADGKVEGGGVICHGHGWKFDLESGQGEGRRACALVYETRLEGDLVLLKAPDSPETPGGAVEEEDWEMWDAQRYFKQRETDDDGSE